MTRIYTLALLLSASFQANAVKRRDCQGDLFSGPGYKVAIRPNASVPNAFRDLPLTQKQIWSWEASNKTEQAAYLRRKLETQMILTRLKEPIARINGHALVPVTEISFLLLRAEPAGRNELAAYILNEKLKRPVKIPVTVKHLGGSAQLWPFYDHGDEILSAEEDRLLDETIHNDADLFLFNFLVSLTYTQKQNVVLDPAAGLFVSNFGEAFRFSMRYFAYNSTPVAGRERALEEISIRDVASLLRAKFKQAKFDWVSALNGLDLENMDALTGRNLTNTETRDLRSRLCVLTAVVNGANFSDCPFP